MQIRFSAIGCRGGQEGKLGGAWRGSTRWGGAWRVKKWRGHFYPEKPGIRVGFVTRLKEGSGDRIRFWMGFQGIEIGWLSKRIAESEMKVGLPDSETEKGWRPFCPINWMPICPGDTLSKYTRAWTMR